MWYEALHNNPLRRFLLAIDGKVTITRAALVVGSQIDPASIANPHIRAHALEGRLFRSVLEEALQAYRIRPEIFIERNVHAQAATKLKESNDNVRRVIQDFG